MTVALLILLKLFVTIIIFGIGLDPTPRDAIRLFRHPALLLRSLLAMYVLVPLAAVALVKLLELPAGVEAALLVLAVSAGAPLLPRKLLGIGDGAYIFSLVVVSSVLAVILVPLWLEILIPLFPRLPHVAPHHAARVLGEIVLPAAAGGHGCPLAVSGVRRPDRCARGRPGGTCADGQCAGLAGRQLARGDGGPGPGRRGARGPDPDIAGHRPSGSAVPTRRTARRSPWPARPGTLAWLSSSLPRCPVCGRPW